MNQPDDARQQLDRVVDALGLDDELAQLVRSGIAKIPAATAQQLLAGLDDSAALIPKILQADVPADPKQPEAAETDTSWRPSSRPWFPPREPRGTPTITERARSMMPLAGADFFAVDLDSARTLIYASGSGLVLDEPSLVAFRTTAGAAGGRVIAAVGSKALALADDPVVQSINPLKHGVIGDFVGAEQMITQFIKTAHQSMEWAPSSRVIFCVPSASSQVELRAITDAALSAGARATYLISEPLAAAIGAGLPVLDEAGSMMVTIRGAMTEAGVVAGGGLVQAGSVRIGTDSFGQAIADYVRRNHGVLIGEQTAAAIKKELGYAFAEPVLRHMEVTGRNLTEGLPRSITLSNHEIYQALSDPLNGIVSSVQAVIEQTSPRFGADIAERGVVLAGSGALLGGIDALLAEQTGLPVRIANDPLTCAVRGGSIALEQVEQDRIERRGSSLHLELRTIGGMQAIDYPGLWSIE
jgi:rod shape-determining protein MreB and related proteins